MPTPSYSAAVVEETCAASGIDFCSLKQVRNHVFSGTLESSIFAGSSEVYVRVYPAERRDGLREFVPIATEVGHPDCILADGEYVCLVMDRARGRPLSRLLPVVFLPGLWNVRRNQYTRAYEQIGTQVGKLHERTKGQSGPVLDRADRERGLGLTRLLDGRLSDSHITTVQYLLEQSDEYEVPYSLTFGDRSPHNMYFDGSRIYQIDNMCKRKSIVYDHVSVLMGIRLMVKRLPYASSSIISALEESYWNGYEKAWDGTVPGEEALSVRYIYKNLRLLEHYDSGVESLNSKLTRRVDPPIAYDEIQRTVADGLSSE